jgi:hypothetical protein
MTKDWGTPERRSDLGRAHRTPGKLPKVPASRQRPLPRQRPPMPKMPAPESSLLRPTAQPTSGTRPLAGISPRSPHPISPVDPLPYAQVVPVPPHLPDAEHLEDSRRAGRTRVRLPKLRFPTSLKFWAIASVLTLTGVSIVSIALLLKLPAVPNCPSIFWPTASASLRLYCAQLAANKQTANDLLEAIELVNNLPADHPLRPEINRHIEEWSQQVLDLAEAAFDRGELSEALDIAKRIPADTSARAQVQERIDRWNEIWSDAEKIYQDAEAALRQQDLRQAFDIAVGLLSIDNTYWKTTKYDELNGLINATRQDAAKLAEARRFIDRGGLSNLSEAVKLAEEIGSGSYAYGEAQKVITEAGRGMLELAESALDRQDADEAIAIIRRIPERANLEAEAQDLTDLASAYSQSWGGTVADLEAAIIQAQRLRRGRPLYGRAQELISRWQAEIQDVMRLETARQLAQPGSVGDLRAAIAEAEQIPRGNPRRAEAQEAIADWTREAETIEDRPILDTADQFANSGDLASAIEQANRIGSGRALSNEARERARDWTSQIQRTQDQPYLDQARELAALGNVPEAIAIAEQIGQGRALYDEAQADIRTWRNQTQGQERMQEAYQAASIGTTTGLIAAIRTAEQVPADSSTRPEAEQMINLWSQQILQAAQQQAGYDLAGAIATAESIPPRTEAYAAAQLQVQTWRQQLMGEEL